MADFKETCAEYIDVNNYATFTSSERKWVNKINKLHEKYPDKVDIICAPEDNQGVILAHIPKSWLKISPPKKSNMSDEAKAVAAERLRALRNCTLSAEN